MNHSVPILDQLTSSDQSTLMSILLEQSLELGGEFENAIDWKIKVLETAQKAGFPVEKAQFLERNENISETRLTIECSHQECEWKNTIKKDLKSQKWIVIDSSTLDLSSHNHELEPISPDDLFDAEYYLDGLRLKQWQELDSIENESDCSDTAISEEQSGYARVDKAGCSDVGSDGENSGRENDLIVSTEKKRPSEEEFVQYSFQFSPPAPRKKKLTEFNLVLGSSKPTAHSNLKPIYKKLSYEPDLPDSLDKLVAGLGKYVEAFAEVGIQSGSDLEYLFARYSEDELEALRVALITVTNSEAPNFHESMMILHALKEKKKQFLANEGMQGDRGGSPEL